MKFLLDLQVLQSASQKRGIGRYSRGLAQALLKSPAGTDASVLLNLAIPQGHAERAAARRPSNADEAKHADFWNAFDEVKQWVASCGVTDRLHVFHGLAQIAGMLSADSTRIHACEALYDAYVGSLGVDLVHVASPFEGFGDDTVVGWTPLSRPGPLRAVTVYDLIPFEAPEIHLADPVREVWYRRRYAGLLKADLLLAISAHTRTVAIDMLGLAPERVVNIGTDTDPIFQKVKLSPQAQASLLARYGISKPFIMHIGILESRKNVETLVRAFAQLPAELRATHQLVLVADATAPQIAHMRTVAHAAGADPDSIIFPGFVPDQDLVGLYSLTRAVVMPSLTEGFGLPLLEAMRCGAPVLGADRTSLPEVVGNREFLFNPEQPAALAEKLVLLLIDEDFRRNALEHCAMQERRFSWNITATRTYEAFKDAIARQHAQPRSAVQERPQYILVPPLDLANDQLARVDKLATTLGETGEVLIASPHLRKFRQMSKMQHSFVAPESLQIASNQRVLIIAGQDGPDLYQCAVLSKIPAAMLLPEQDAQVPMPAEWRYWLDGYQGLLADTNSNCGNISLNALLAVYPQILGVIQSADAPEQASKIATLYANHPIGTVLRLLPELHGLDAVTRVDVASATAENHALVPPRPRLLVDVSELVHRDAKTGIQRVVRKALTHLLTVADNLRVEPIYREGDNYRYARRFTCRFLNLSPLNLRDTIVDFHPSDTFLGLDLDAFITQRAADLLARLRHRGGSVNFLIYDLLPLMRPEWFIEGTELAFDTWFHRITMAANRIIAISRSTADDTIAMLEKKNIQRIAPLDLAWCHIGSDFTGLQILTNDLMADIANGHADALFRIAGRTMFLTVGTLEPRKGISQLLDAAEDLWRDQDVVFVLVGKEGWYVDSLLSRIKTHPELGKRLFWFGYISDELLERFYRMATAAVLPSQAEGFGLPLVEAARYGTPIIARDIPVFREIGGSGVFYCKAEDGRELAASLRHWLELHEKSQEPKSANVKVLNWRETTEYLLDATQGSRSYRSWTRPNTAPSSSTV